MVTSDTAHHKPDQEGEQRFTKQKSSTIPAHLLKELVTGGLSPEFFSKVVREGLAEDVFRAIKQLATDQQGNESWI